MSGLEEVVKGYLGCIHVTAYTAAVYFRTKLLRLKLPTVTFYCFFYQYLNISFHKSWGTGIIGLMKGMATLNQGKQELSVVRDNVGRPQVSLG